ncbi:MAG: hypothetical protein H0T46_29700 [Deltaproteobacteria bacterium]|nr:hypothetical protein [Deltaproteobacteria bacterium]
MTEMNDPVRLSIGGSSDVQDLLRAARDDGPSAVQLNHLAARLAPVVMAPPAASSVLPWIVAGVTVMAVAIGGVWWMRDDGSKPVPVVATTAPVVVPSEAPAPAPVAPVKTAIDPEPPGPEPVRAQRKKRVVAEPTAVEEAPKPKEMDLLGPAHVALREGDATRALELATRHEQLYARGMMTEEREAIAIEALHRLGRDDARTRLTSFVERFPRSGYRARLERLVPETKR